MSTEFYVGYLPLPSALASRLRLLIPLLVLGLVGTGVALTVPQTDPGPGVWRTGEVTELTGRVVAQPYPMLIARDQRGDPRTVFLVTMGKGGEQVRAAALAGQEATVRGHLVTRDGQWMLTVRPEPEAFVGQGPATTPLLPAADLGRFRLTGEIVDTKCFLGAMKPASGKVHKACATLCIRGGIPPTFVTETPAGERAYYLVTDAHGRPDFAAIEALIADPVQATGTLERHGDLTWFKLDPGSLVRLR